VKRVSKKSLNDQLRGVFGRGATVYSEKPRSEFARAAEVTVRASTSCRDVTHEQAMG
jgi:hypothetical protein